jgi:hypothetical protein
VKHPKNKGGPRAELAFATSMMQAESMTGLTKDFMRWAKSRGCTAFRGSKIYIADLKAFNEENASEWEEQSESVVDGSQEAVNRERIISMRKQQRKLDREHEVAMGKLVDMDLVKEKTARYVGVLTGIMKKTLSREDYNACARQFQKTDLDL